MNEWISVENRKPPIYALVRIRDENGKEQTGWWTGFDWDYGKKRIDKEYEWTKCGFNIIT